MLSVFEYRQKYYVMNSIQLCYMYTKHLIQPEDNKMKQNTKWTQERKMK